MKFNLKQFYAFCSQLLRVAKDKRVRVVVASWDIDEFDVKRKR